MSEENNNKRRVYRWSLDTWAVVAAFLAATVVKTGLLKHVPW